MIIDLQKFIKDERRYWKELESMLDVLESETAYRMNVEQVKRFHYLYQRTSADLAKIMTFSSEQEIHQYLESLIVRSYGNIHEIREKAHRLSPLHWFFNTFPQTFRRHRRAFYLSFIIFLCGFIFGGFAISFDSDAKAIIMPFPHLKGDPSERVAHEETAEDDDLQGIKMTGAAWYMTHNTKVSVFIMALGITWGIGTLILLFYNGIIIGAVSLDYVLANEANFLVAWLFPHGVIEIPAVLLAGQAGFVLGYALIGWGERVSLRTRLRKISKDLITLISGVALMLIWAGIIESFISQYHEPVIPYSFKIGFGVVELIVLTLFLTISGRNLSRKHAERKDKYAHY